MRSISTGRLFPSPGREESPAWRRRSLVALACIGGWLCAPLGDRVSAQPAGHVHRATILVDAPPSCPEAAALESLVRARLAPEAPETAAPTTLQVTLTRRTGRVHAEIALGAAMGASRVRSIDAPTCKEAVDAAALIGALLIDPLAASRAPAPAAVTESAEAAPVEVSPAPAAPLPRPMSLQSDAGAPAGRPRTPRVGLLPAALMVGGVAPRVRPAGGLSAVVRGSPLPALELAARAGARLALSHDEARAEGRVAFGWWSAVAALCGGWRPHGLITLAACSVSEYGRIGARGVSARNPRRSVRPWAALGPGLSLTWHISRRLSLDASGEALVPLLRDRFLLADRVVHDVPGLTFRAQLGLLVGIW